MKKTVRTFAIYIFAVVLAVFCLFTVSAQSFITAHADSRAESAPAFDHTNVLDDLEGGTIAGEDFDLADYPYSQNGRPQLITFVEYCYAYYESDRDNFGLYAYVYNPGGFAFDSVNNAIQFRAGDAVQPVKYPLSLLNYSTEPGAEGLFYKFKVVMTAEEQNTLLSSLDSDARVYELSGIELSRNGTITEYEVGSTYTYSGYAAGYGAFEGNDSTLICSVEDFEKYLTLDVRTTYYRPDGPNGEAYTRDTLHSVYFSVPNEIVESYGDMTAVHATWLNAQTSPVFVTGNSQVYSTLTKFLGQTVDGGNFHYASEDTSPLGYALIASKYIESAGSNNASYGFSYMSYNANREYTASDVNLYMLAYAFLADNNDADSYIVPAEALIGNKKEGIAGWFETYTEEYGKGTAVDGRFSSDLFSEVDDEYTDITISTDDTFELTEQVISQDLWQQFVGGGYHVEATNTYTISAIKKVESSDFKQTTAATCEGLYIDESDYKEFKAYYDEAQRNNETVYLFRYYQSPYKCYEVATYARGEGSWTILGTNFGYDFIDTNAYFMQMWVQLGFDIIDLTFTKDDVSTVIPVVMSPIDIAADGEPPIITNDDNADVPWLTIVIILAVSIGGIAVTQIIRRTVGKEKSKLTAGGSSGSRQRRTTTRRSKR